MAARVLNLTPNRLEPPPHLAVVEATMWTAIAKEYRFTAAAELDALTATLESHARARRCRQIIDEQGEMIPGRLGLVPHPLLRHEAVARAGYMTGLRLLRLDIGTPIRR